MRTTTTSFAALLAAAFICNAPGALAQSENLSVQDWIRLGEKVHGGFGAFIPLGIRIGQDALKRLGAGPREVSVVYFDGEKTPCACIADGILIATSASPGQGTLRVASEKAAPGMLGIAVISHRKTGRSVRYQIPMEVLPRVGEWNKTLDTAGRYSAVMKAEGLFSVSDPAQ